jgi:hypothetical protein
MQLQESTFLSDKFIPFGGGDGTGSDPPDIKGTVLLPNEQNKNVTVVRYALRVKRDGAKSCWGYILRKMSALLIFLINLTVLCNSSFLPQECRCLSQTLSWQGEVKGLPEN